MLVNRKRFTTAIDKKLHERLFKYSKETMIPVSKLLDEAIADLLKKRKVK